MTIAKSPQTLMSKKFFSMLFGGTLTMMVVSILLIKTIYCSEDLAILSRLEESPP